MDLTSFVLYALNVSTIFPRMDPSRSVKVTGDNLLIYVSAYSLFIGLCSVTSDMIGCSHSYHSIKLPHCGAPQRDVFSYKMML